MLGKIYQLMCRGETGATRGMAGESLTSDLSPGTDCQCHLAGKSTAERLNTLIDLQLTTITMDTSKKIPRSTLLIFQTSTYS